MIRARAAEQLKLAKIPHTVVPDSGGGKINIHTDPHIIYFPVSNEWQARITLAVTDMTTGEVKQIHGWEFHHGFKNMLAFIDNETNLREQQLREHFDETQNLDATLEQDFHG